MDIYVMEWPEKPNGKRMKSIDFRIFAEELGVGSLSRVFTLAGGIICTYDDLYPLYMVGGSLLDNAEPTCGQLPQITNFMPPLSRHLCALVRDCRSGIV